MSHENLLYKLVTRDMQLDWPATKSLEQGKIIFENFDTSCKNKSFPKTTKTLKKNFVFDQQKLSMWKHI